METPCWNSGTVDTLTLRDAELGQTRCSRCGRVLKVRPRRTEGQNAMVATLPRHNAPRQRDTVKRRRGPLVPCTNCGHRHVLLPDYVGYEDQALCRTCKPREER